jgi:hypothetical protein
MAEKNRLLIVVQRFADIDLHAKIVSNAEMGDLFEELIRKFAEASIQTGGEHFTPRDAIRLIVELVFANDDAALSEKGVVWTVYDPDGRDWRHAVGGRGAPDRYGREAWPQSPGPAPALRAGDQ